MNDSEVGSDAASTSSVGGIASMTVTAFNLESIEADATAPPHMHSVNRQPASSTLAPAEPQKQQSAEMDAYRQEQSANNAKLLHGPCTADNAESWKNYGVREESNPSPRTMKALRSHRNSNPTKSGK